MTPQQILEKMTLEDKIALCSGKNFWETKEMSQYGIPSVFMCDGPHGLRKQVAKGDMLGINNSEPATCFPTAVTTGASWDVELLEEIGEAIGEEAAAYEVGIVLGPGANIKRDPLCGRNFEYFSEDPYISGKMAAAFIKGVQKNGTAASLKHFACNSQEFNRFTSDGVVDERTLREIYLTAFEMAVKEAQPGTVMCSYPKINGIHASDSKELLNDILREEWGFEGLVVTDWGAMNDRIKGFAAGCDLNMPGGSAYMEKDVLKAVQNGELSEEAVDACALRILKLAFANRSEKIGLKREAHHEIARKAAEQGAVLLKNDESILPLKENSKIVLIGHMAKEPRYQGAGSSHINPFQVVSAVDAMPDKVFVQGCDAQGNTDETMLAEAIKAAKEAEIAVVFAGLPSRYESEGFDRADLKMPEGHVRMIEAVAEASQNTVVVLQCGCAVECAWEDKVKAILYMGLHGQAGGEAVKSLLYGKVNPSGKLTESWGYTYEDYPTSSYYRNSKDALYKESVYVGYRYFDKAKKAVRYPFGYGLSYTSFAYSDLKVTGNTVTATVTNTGTAAGAEVVQLYVQASQDGIHRPLKELKGFTKVFLQLGESKVVSFTLDERSFAVWQDGWQVPAGTYQILVGGSSKDLPLSVSVKKQGIVVEVPEWQKGSWYETMDGFPKQEEWEKLLGRKYEPKRLKKGEFTMDNTVIEMKDESLLMKLIYNVVAFYFSLSYGGKNAYKNPEYQMMIASSVGGPLRSLQIFSGIKGGLFKGMLDIANGRFLKGIKTMITG